MDKLESMIRVLKCVVAVVVGTLAKWLGGDDTLIDLMIMLVCCDTIFGITKGMKEHNFASSILYWGLVNKATMFVWIAIMYKVDQVLSISILRNTFIIWFCLCDCASIVENTATIGMPWPDGLLKILVQVRKGFSINISKIVKQIIDNYGIETNEKDGE
ncbi:hypothetical protein lbkm_3848 [Lachnospiraceae bacterium KM106-2]|nr:hypothetical protein lbkm_3848 [Lachnospiraceae bacterium KM106-2]